MATSGGGPPGSGGPPDMTAHRGEPRRSGADGGPSGRGAQQAGSTAQTGGLLQRHDGRRIDVGKLSFIDNAVDTATGTVQLKATFDNSTGRLWAGQFAATSLHLFDRGERARRCRTQAVVDRPAGTYVYVVDQADTARQRAVIVERTAGGLPVIASGIHDGDRVVTEGQSRLTPDAPVRLRGAAGGAHGRGRRRRRRGGRGGGGGGGKRGRPTAAAVRGGDA